MITRNIKFFIYFLIFVIFISIPLLVVAYGAPPQWCYNGNDCTNCTYNSTRCLDDQEGYNATCVGTGHWCPFRYDCVDFTGKEIQTCEYLPETPCECSGVGYQDPPFWGGCGDCTTNPLYPNENCEPCGQAYAYCDGCNWDTNWSNHKCAGSPKSCSPNDRWCDPAGEGGTAWTCSSDGCSKSSGYCGASNWASGDPNEYQCSGTMRQRKYIYRGCSGGSCYANEIYYDWEQCNDHDGWYGSCYRNYYCSNGACAYTESCCDCSGYGVGWHDAPFWGGCGDCTTNPLYPNENCQPCGQAYAYCDGCNWDTSSWKCAGSPKICTPYSNWCEGPYAQHCSSDGCSKSSEYCGTSDWTNEYRCSGDMVQRKYANRGCSGGSCYSNDIWYDWEYCNNYDNCYVYSNGCEDRNYYCSSGACTYSVSNRHTDYYDAYVNYCADAINLRTHRLLHDYYCTGVTCTDHQSWQNDSFVENCNGRDTCVGPNLTTWRDWYCSGTACAYTDYPGHSNCNQAPSIPSRNNPPDSWINYNPTFTVTSTDPNGNNYRAYFNILGYGDNWSGWTNSGQPASWGSLNLGNCFNNWWRAYSQDTFSFNSAWSGYWQVKVDKDNPSSSISYPTGTYVNLSFTVSLTESDTCSGIAAGDVDIRIKVPLPVPGWGSWQDYTSTINDFSFTGIDGYSYQFRYRVMDNAGNWSNFTEGGTVTITLNKPPTTTNLNVSASDPCDLPPFYSFKFTYTDPEANTESRFDFQADNNSNFLSPEIDRTFSNLNYPSPTEHTQTISLATTPMSGYLAYNTIYYWRARTYDQYGLVSNWAAGSQISTFVYKSPSCDFTLAPQQPVPLEAVVFTDNSRCWDEDPVNGSDCSSSKGDTFSWDFDVDNKGGVDPETSTNEAQTVKFSKTGTYTVKLTVADRGGHTCSTTKTIKTSLPLPKWKEIRPW